MSPGGVPISSIPATPSTAEESSSQVLSEPESSKLSTKRPDITMSDLLQPSVYAPSTTQAPAADPDTIMSDAVNGESDLRLFTPVVVSEPQSVQNDHFISGVDPFISAADPSLIFPPWAPASSSRPSSIALGTRSVASGRGRVLNRARSDTSLTSALSSVESRFTFGHSLFRQQNEDRWKVGLVFARPSHSRKLNGDYSCYDDTHLPDNDRILVLECYVVVRLGIKFNWCVPFCSGSRSGVSEWQATIPPQSIVPIHSSDPGLVNRDLAKGIVYIKPVDTKPPYLDIDGCLDFTRVQEIPLTTRILPVAGVIDLRFQSCFQQNCDKYSSPTIDGKRRKRATKVFRPGRVFVIDPHPAGVPADTSAEPVQGRLNYLSCYIVCRAIRWSASCIAFPILTYGGRGLLGRTFSAAEIADHAIAYTTDEPVVFKMNGELEPSMSKEAIKVMLDKSHRGCQLVSAARINFARPCPVEYNELIRPIGNVHENYMDQLRSHWQNLLQ